MAEEERIVPKKGQKKATDEEIIEGFDATGGNISKTSAWLLKEKGISISDRAISKRMKYTRSLRLARTLAMEKAAAIRENRPFLLRVKIPEGPLRGGPPPKISDNLLKRALRKADGSYAGARRYLKMVYDIDLDPAYIAHRVMATPELRETEEDIRETILDEAEYTIHKLVRAGDYKASTFYLEHKGRSRGFGRGPIPPEPEEEIPKRPRMDFSKIKPEKLLELTKKLYLDDGKKKTD